MSPATELHRREDGTFYETSVTPLRLAIGPSGQIIDLNEAEADEARERALEESRRRQRESEDADRAVDAAAVDAHQQACREQLQRELPPHLRS
jgi:hypothetical protein